MSIVRNTESDADPEPEARRARGERAEAPDRVVGRRHGEDRVRPHEADRDDGEWEERSPWPSLAGRRALLV